MEFKDLSVEVQVIAADALRTLILEERFSSEKKAVTQLAQEVRNAFVELYSKAGNEEKSAQNEALKTDFYHSFSGGGLTSISQSAFAERAKEYKGLESDIEHVFYMIQLLIADMSVSTDDLITKPDAANRITKENSEVLHGLANSLAAMQAALELRG